jgi:MFS family permease
VVRLPEPFRYRAFRRVWIGSAVSNIGTWMQTFALGFYVADLTEAAAWSGAIAALEFLPTAILGPIGGALADRYSRRGLLLASTIGQALLTALLTAVVANGDPAPEVIAIYALLNGCIWALGFPAFQAILPELVPPDQIPGAVGLSSAQWNLGRVIGPAIGGAVYHWAGIQWALAINTVSFVAVVIALVGVALPGPVASAPRSILGSIADGWRYVRSDPGQRTVVSTYALLGLCLGPFIGLVPAFVVKVLDAGPGASAAMITAQGLGAVVTGVAVGTIGPRLGLDRLLLWSCVALPVALIGYAFSPGVVVAVLSIFVVGLLYFAVFTSLSSITQLRAPANFRGRVLAINNLALGLAYPAGLFIQGALGDAIGLRVTTAGFALVALVVVVAVVVAFPQVRASVEPSQSASAAARR